ncbi:Non-reducing polyketide synthase ausA [Penicillium rolfsii]|nr:Non-reducing polyketide synthase ausA [Penicillium rolfsii]
MSLEKPLTVLYREIDGSKITTDLYLPANTSASPQKYPVVIDIHGGAFMLGHSRMVSLPQVNDCLERGWIVLVPNHRLCPGVNLLEGPMQDIRYLLSWVYDGQLDAVLKEQGAYRADLDNVAAFGTSSGGHLALGLGFDVRKPVKAILSLYGAVHFTDPLWTKPIPQIAAKLPPNLSEPFLNKVYDQKPVPTDSSVSLEGQTESGVSKGPDFSKPRDAFAFTQIASGTVLSAIYPESQSSDPEFKKVDPAQNVSSNFPPTYIVHGQADTMVPIELSREFFKRLQKAGVKCGMTEVPNEEHTFAAMMKVGSETWWLQRKGFDFLEEIIGKGPQ